MNIKNYFQESQKSAHPVDETELHRLNCEREQLLETVLNQSSQIEKQRKENSRLEAQIVVIQQDRNETQVGEKCKIIK